MKNKKTCEFSNKCKRTKLLRFMGVGTEKDRFYCKEHYEEMRQLYNHRYNYCPEF